MRVIVHPGFHKTATTTVQKTLRANRALLRPYLRIVLRPGMIAVCEAARAWSAAKDPLDEALFRYETGQLAERLDPDDARPVLISSEDLSGHMPGRRGLKGYDAAPALMSMLVETFAKTRPQARLSLHFSTREPQAWLRSCWVQHLRAKRMTSSFEEYATSHAASAALDEAVDRVCRSVAPVPVSRQKLEDCSANPLAPLLSPLGLPENVLSAIVPHPPANTAPATEKLHALLTLNRSELTGAAYDAAKADLLRRSV